MLRKQWQDYALKAKQIAKHIVTGLEQNKKGVRLIQIVYGLDMYATDALNLKYSKQRSKSSVHTYQGGRQEISTQHADGSEGLFKSNGEFQPTNNPMDTEVEEYMNNNLDENKQYKANTNMNKKLIRLTEQDLHKIVKESVNKILMEAQSEGVQVRPYTENVFAVGNNSGVKFYVDRRGRFYDGNMQPTKNVACLTDYDAQQVANQLNKALGNMFHYDMFRGGNSMQ